MPAFLNGLPAFTPLRAASTPGFIPLGLAIVPERSGAAFIEAICVARRFPLAVFNRPPRTVAPSRPIPLIRPLLSRFSRFPALVAALRVAGVLRFGAPPPGELANLPRLSRV